MDVCLSFRADGSFLLFHYYRWALRSQCLLEGCHVLRGDAAERLAFYGTFGLSAYHILVGSVQRPLLGI